MNTGERYDFEDQSDAILKNLRDRSKDIEEVSKQIRRAREMLKRHRRRAPPKGMVYKRVMQGMHGGLYYLNNRGKRVYLTPRQCKRCVEGRYPVRVSTPDDKLTNQALGCPPASPKATKCQMTRGEMKREIRRLRKYIDEDC